MEIHVVKKGDTMFKIARQHGVELSYLLSINGIKATDPLIVGQAILVLKPKTVYTVAAGDSLDKISQKYNVTINELYRLNPFLRARPYILEGQKIVISLEDESMRKAYFYGYCYLNIDTELLMEVSPFLSFLCPFTYGIEEDGSLIPLDDYALKTVAQNYGVPSFLHLSTLGPDGKFSENIARDILTNGQKKQKLMDEVTKMIIMKNYAGLDIDFEYVPGEFADDYANLVREFTRSLNGIGKKVIVALAPKTSSNQKGVLYEGHDYKQLGAAANGCLLMTYEWGYTYGPPMAVAPINSVKKVLSYALTQIKANKIFLGIPNYGYDFRLPYVKGESKARLIGNEQALEIARAQNAAINFDDAAGSPFFEYYLDGQKHIVWFEDARSIKKKLALIDEYNLAGAGYWNLMRPFTVNFQILNAMYDIFQ